MLRSLLWGLALAATPAAAQMTDPRTDEDFAGRGFVAGEDVAKISLRLDEPPALPDGHQRRTDGSIAMRVQLHRRTHDIRDLVKAPVVHVPERVQHPALHQVPLMPSVVYRRPHQKMASSHQLTSGRSTPSSLLHFHH